MKSASASRSTPGTGILAMNRKITSIASVKRIFRRRSGILNALTTASSIGTAPYLVLRLAGLSRNLVAVCRAADLAETSALELAVQRQRPAPRTRGYPAISPLDQRH